MPRISEFALKQKMECSAHIKKHRAQQNRSD